ncbi:acyl-CoA dehydrogenase [Klebsiella pneumoniae]|uniref:Acyl-CoA dehydrogenase n=1 Tax=Klebsiella pneumoniae TaxID=573 RepID=A0A2X3GUP7_KLEPN|nr:acyl-CoA dehydrogenase [Klebsiella pneumoniae]
MGDWQGQQVLGMRLTWNKRYITLAPIATVLGLAFKLSDPDRLLGGEEELGITCALIPTSTPGVEIGRRHFPLNVPFQNGPTRGKDIFVPIDYIIGGPSMAGQGWRMLVECLSVGRRYYSAVQRHRWSEIRCHGDWRLRPYSPPVQNLHRQNGRD